MAKLPLRYIGLPLGLLVGASSLVCGGSHPALVAPPAGDPAGLLIRSAPPSTGALAFPPAQSGRSPRARLPVGYSLDDRTATLLVSEPSLDGGQSFSITGTAVQLVFNQPVSRPAAPAIKGKGKEGPIPAAKGTLRITPEVAATVLWIDERTLELKAHQPFDPDVTYTVELGEVSTPGGKTLDSPWKATFTASPSFIVAGKELGYLPVAGEHRVIAVHPYEDAQVSRSPVLSALYDQPIDLALGRTLIHLEDQHGKGIPFAVEHPVGPMFQGIKVDPRHVLLIRPTTRLAPDTRVKLGADDRGASSPTRTISVNVVEPLEKTDVSCGFGYSSDASNCSYEKDVLSTNGKAIHVTFNNAIATSPKALAQRVRVTPFVKNLTVRNDSSSEGRLMISGAFEPSHTYEVNIDGLVDAFEQPLVHPVRFKVVTEALSASVAMSEGLLVLDEASTKRFQITTRNVSSAEIVAWPVPPNSADELQKALDLVHARELPEGGTPVVVPVSIKAERDRDVETAVDLGGKLDPRTTYVTTVRATGFAFDAAPMAFPGDSEAGKPPVALLRPGNPRTLAAHVRAFSNGTLVEVTRLGSGEPVSGAAVRFSGDEVPAAVTTDASGLALLPVPGGSADRMLQVTASDADLLLPLGGEGLTAKQLFPHLVTGLEPGAVDRRAMIVTDRGIYRPGSSVFLKASVRRPEGVRLLPVANAPLVARVLGPTGDEAMRERLTTDDRGSVATRFAVPADAKLGRYQLRIEDPARPDPPLALSVIQVAEFETPRFAVDVDAGTALDAKNKAPAIHAVVRGRYLFGAPMDGASVKWTLKRRLAPFAAGPLTEALSFRRRPSWHDGDDGDGDEPVGKPWSRAGDGKIAPDGTFKVEQGLQLDPGLGPQEFVLEADVADASFRHIAGRAAVIEHPARRYAGLKLGKGWVDAGETFPVELGVIDTEGKPVTGARVTAHLERVAWSYVERRSAGGALRSEWASRRTDEGRCTITSEHSAVACKLTARRSGEYEVSAEVDGRKGGVTRFWAYHDGDESTAAAFPTKGRTVEIVTDKPRYRPGDIARLLVRSPWPTANALLTIEQGGLLAQRAVRITGGAVILDLPLEAQHAPWVHATITLLPVGVKGEAIADYRVGAVRIPVALEASRLDLAIRSDRPTYEPGQEVEITLEARDAGKPRANAEIALAVVDEGVLRLTGFHAIDPVSALRPGRALSFRLRDSRQGLASLFERSHIAGDGGAGEGTVTSTRKDFVETALWRPDLRTDATGKAVVRLRLPDNLTQFRMMAVALDEEGKGAVSEASFTVKKPVMLVPVLPRFAAVGDHFEAAAMLHNNTGDPFTARVNFSQPSAKAQSTTVTVSPAGKSRVAFPIDATAPGDLALVFSVEDQAGKVLDRVEHKLRVEEPGLDEHPSLQGSFLGRQEISLAVPDDVRLLATTMVSVEVGQHLWPELGQRLDYLLGYPHGCVEQTTSSTLPLIAARGILPRIGFRAMSDEALKTRIKAGLDRLATMRTGGGGLAYWPGGDEPNLYGTAYAMRAVVLGTRAGVEAPKGLLEGMRDYLKAQLLSHAIKPEVQAAIAQSLGELGELPPSAADALHDRRDNTSVFGQASLALALHSLGGEDDRIKALLDAVEKSFDEKGTLLVRPRGDDFYYYGSPTRTKAQAAIALRRLRPSSRILPLLLTQLAESTESYTTQATSYALLALSEQLQHEAPEGAPVVVTLDGTALSPTRELPSGAREYRIPAARLRGKKSTLTLVGEGEVAMGFLVSAFWQRPLPADGALAATSTDKSPEIYRVFTDARGGAVDLTKVHAGDLLRVALLVRMPTDNVPRERLGYLAVTDRIPAGFEPIQPDLATVASAPDVSTHHPFSSLLRGWEDPASHVELHDDRVNMYFDRASHDAICATYLVRATTPGDFALPPAAAELMYEGDSLGTSEAGRVSVR